MKTLIITILLCMYPLVALAGSGEVIADEVCGMDNIIIETSDYYYVAAEWYGGHEFETGDKVFGEFKHYGMTTIYAPSGAEGSYYIDDWESDLESALEEHCD